MPAKASKTQRMFRSKTNRMLSGVCGGIAEYTGIDPTIVRLLFIAVIFFSCGAGILLYLAALLIMPLEPTEGEPVREVRTLYRSRTERMVSGVLGGLADYLEIDPSICRLAFAAITILTAVLPAILLYFIMVLIVPLEELSFAPTPGAEVEGA